MEIKYKHIMKKKLFASLLLFGILVSCYEDYINDFDYSSIYIPLQLDVRTFVVGEGMKFDLGVEMGGIRDNVKDRIVTFQVDNSLINPAALNQLKGAAAYISAAVAPVTTLLPLPSNYYSLTNNSQFVIKQGAHQGKITVKPDSTRFLADPATIIPTYAIGIKLLSADSDSLISSKKTEIIAVKFENMFFGNYWHGGVTTIKDPSDATVVNTINYYTQIPVSEVKTWALKTVTPYSVAANGYSDVSSSPANEFVLTVNGANVTISSAPTGKYVIQPDGASTYNQAKLLQNRRIYLSYKYRAADGNWYHAKDTLTFRNRIRDGVNEWQDENPANYK
jgi:hypothetical protein